MNIADLVTNSWQTAEDHGWHSPPKSFGDDIALIHSELSEALEEFRNGHKPSELYFGEGGKPEGVPSELADVLIRVADLCAVHGIDIEAATKAKADFNRTRPWRHGGKKL
jgi:NTP pyrophosphatase (non-canonical NTP hydrolase)